MTLDKGPANKQEASRAWERMVGVWGEGHIYKSTKSAHRSNECGFGKRLEDRRDLEWSEKGRGWQMCSRLSNARVTTDDRLCRTKQHLVSDRSFMEEW